MTRDVALESPARGDARAGALAIETVDLVKRYRRVTALDGLQLAVPRGETIGFLGPNGAGKTTAVKILLGLTRPTSGRATVLGEPPGSRAARRRLGYLPELFRYQDWLSAREVLELHSRLIGVPSAALQREVDTALEVVGLVPRAEHRVGTFSKGMQQRLGLGVALLGSPELVFLDEPTSALDPVGRYDVREIIRSLQQRGTTVFLNSHLLTEVEQVCHRVVIIDHGRMIASGPMDEVLGQGSAVSVRVRELTSGAETTLRERFGAFTVEADQYAFRVPPAHVPELVAELVRLGGRVYGVEQRSESLEDRFLQLLDGSAR